MHTVFFRTSCLLCLAFVVASCSKDEGAGIDEEVLRELVKLQLKADLDHVKVGTRVSFTVTANGEPVHDAILYVDGLESAGNQVSFQKPGRDIHVVASKAGFYDSEPVTIDVYQNDFYMAGTGSTGSGQSAYLWKNGGIQQLKVSSGVPRVSAVALSGDNVYVSGTVQKGGVDVATFWKNGSAQEIRGRANTIANDIAVSGDKVFVAGYESVGSFEDAIYAAVIWENQEARRLSPGAAHSFAYAVYVANGDVYVAGLERASFGSFSKAMLWKNGTRQELTDGKFNAGAYDVFVSGNDVYVAGYESNGGRNVAKVWKNGTAMNLSDGRYFAAAEAVFVTGKDVYVAGYETLGSKNNAKLWKNGEVQPLANGTASRTAQSVYVDGSNVFVGGYELAGGSSKIVFWRNGEAEDLTMGGGWRLFSASDIIVTRRYQ